MKLLITGSQTFDNGAMLHEVAKEFKPITEILLCGLKVGADMMALNYGNIWGIPLRKGSPKKADAVLIFWDGKDAKTKQLIDTFKGNGMRCKVVMFGLQAG